MRKNIRKIRIEWGDCDPAGIIFNPKYFEIFDAASAALFEQALGVVKRKMLEKFNCAGMPLVRTEAQFHRPACYGDDLFVESSIKFGRSSFQVTHRVTLNGELCAEGFETRVWVIRDSNGAIKSSAIPNAILEAFNKDALVEA
ncbi:acyl-CoA thioesterase [Pseudorhodoplanes sp.]|uniref:acyl-CoA thioesterase n=1 Tax=Pseudorhodoplanes sp. TaxID=1934341 RepID=UPI003D14906E